MYKPNRTQQHPLEFLAQRAIQGSKNDISNRHEDGLLCKDSKKVLSNDIQHALSDQTQNIIHSLNQSRIVNQENSNGANVQKMMNMTAPLSFNSKQQSEDIIDIMDEKPSRE